MDTLWAINEAQDDTENSGPFAVFDSRDRAKEVMVRYAAQYPLNRYTLVPLTLNLDPEDA